MKVTRQAEEEVEEVYPSENIQVIQPDMGEIAAVVYPTVVKASKENEIEPEVAEIETEVNEIEPQVPEVRQEEEHVDNSDSHFNEVDDTADESADATAEMTTLSAVDEEMTTELPEETTINDQIFEESANPAKRENENAPILLESSWEEKDVVIKQKNNHKNCMEMNNDLFINVMSTIFTTLTEFEYSTVQGLNSVVFKSEGGCLPTNVNELFTSSCVLKKF